MADFLPFPSEGENVMQGTLVRGIAMAIAGLVLLAAPSGAAQDDDDADWSPSTNQCNLGLYVDEQGSATFSLTIVGKISSDLTPKQVEQALGKALGDSLRDVRRHKAAGVISITGRAEKVFPPIDGVVEGEMDLASLGEL